VFQKLKEIRFVEEIGFLEILGKKS